MNEYKQLTLGEAINRLNKCNLFNEDNKSKPVFFDFKMAVPTYLDSWRGSYDELALGYEFKTLDNNFCYAKDLLKELNSGIHNVYEGWKGGDFMMDADTPLWADNSGECTNVAIVDIIDCDDYILIITRPYEY